MRILLVEDDKVVRVTVRDALEDAGHAVMSVGDGTVAQAVLARAVFDLLLTDVRLPGVDGFALLRTLKELQPGCIAILMTAYGQVDEAVTAIREGALDYITKPFDIDELIRRIARVDQEPPLRTCLSQ